MIHFELWTDNDCVCHLHAEALPRAGDLVFWDDKRYTVVNVNFHFDDNGELHPEDLDAESWSGIVVNVKLTPL